MHDTLRSVIVVFGLIEPLFHLNVSWRIRLLWHVRVASLSPPHRRVALVDRKVPIIGIYVHTSHPVLDLCYCPPCRWHGLEKTFSLQECLTCIPLFHTTHPLFVFGGSASGRLLRSAGRMPLVRETRGAVSVRYDRWSFKSLLILRSCLRRWRSSRVFSSRRVPFLAEPVAAGRFALFFFYPACPRNLHGQHTSLFPEKLAWSTHEFFSGGARDACVCVCVCFGISLSRNSSRS